MRRSPSGRIAEQRHLLGVLLEKRVHVHVEPAFCAIACRCFTQLIEPDSASTTIAALAIESARMMSRGL